MKRISTATSVANKFGAGKNGFTDGNVLGGVPATDLQGDWFDHVQEELANLIEATGTALDAADRTQLLVAVRKLASGRLLNIRLISGSTIYTETAGTRFCEIIVQAPGGGSAGSAATGAGQLSAGTGGNSGSCASSYVPVAQLSGASLIVGASGTAGAAGGAGGTGGTSSAFLSGGVNIQCPGGAGGVVVGPVAPPSLGATAINNTLASGGNLYNGATGAGQAAHLTSTGAALSGAGADTIFGHGPRGNQVSGAGGTAVNYGCGGSGALSGVSDSAKAGGAGGQGVFIIREYA